MSLEDMTQQEREVHALGLLTRKLAHDPSVGSQLKRILLKGDQRLKFPELEVEDQIALIKKEQSEATQKVQQELLQMKAQAEQERLHTRVAASGLDLKDVLELMVAHGLSATEKNYDMAVEVLLSRRATMAESTPDALAPPQGPDIEEMWKDPRAWSMKQATKIMDQEILPLRRRGQQIAI